MLLCNAWYIAAWADEVGAEPLARRICNEPIVLFRDGSNRVAALADRCYHRGAPLHVGTVVADGIQCGYHGLVIDGSGRCVRIPGQVRIPEDARVQSYPAVEKDQLVWLWMATWPRPTRPGSSTFLIITIARGGPTSTTSIQSRPITC